MGYSYGTYGALFAFMVVGLCTFGALGHFAASSRSTDLLFTGDGEAFNVHTVRRLSPVVLI